MNIVLLSGGSGKRLWPLSNDIRSKQFIKIFRRPEHSIPMGSESSDGYESMVQRVYRQIKTVDKDATVTIATSKSQVSAIHNQLGNDVGISVEPCRRDTFPAIALATAYLHYVQGIGKDEAVVVCPVDPYVNDDYFEALKKLWELAQDDTANLTLMGIDPTYPSEKFGYIMPVTKDKISKVSEFKEKPDTKTAQKYIDAGGLWNGGVFAYKLRYVLDRAHELIDFTDYYDLFDKYDSLKKISFDYAVVEHEDDIAVLRFAGEWKDLGTWNTLTEAMEEKTVGDARLDDICENVHIINELDVPILAMGMKNAVIAASPEGILVSDMEQSSFIKPYVDAIDQQIMFAEKSWGSYRVLDVEEESMTVKVSLDPGHQMYYHSHMKRDEVWTIISGSGIAVIDDKKIEVTPGLTLSIPAGCKHTVIAGKKGLQLIELQLGEEINSEDKQKYDLCIDID
ncbi:mannose-1-phosphate guanylyltransferase [Ruminococcus sp. YE71]|uniref:sugar phosphate nucleotidyltransferase n=1 Tax=unclassified Ruminococcus TaxID=2608920 RepID=UPI00088B8DFB|nr:MULTISPECIES: sugar phosphate nucleotidyltransferase [unclassified Ruminococcus]SDA24266.1 mannose-1-phosphate guanylyltransferase [Ruminococcus sp. YE78]SFW41727.1 mannose-1-phosphate guanylyltransferase [Ruminococcus sp. YE71]